MTSLHALMTQLPLLAMQQQIINETQQSIATLSNGVFREAKGPVLSPQEIQKDGCHACVVVILVVLFLYISMLRVAPT